MASNKLIRFVVTVDEEAYRALVKYQVDNKLTRDNALKAILKGQSGAKPNTRPGARTLPQYL